MTQIVLSFIKKIPDILSAQKTFVLLLALVISGFVLNVLLIFLVNDYTRKNRVWFVFLSMASVLFQTAWCVYFKISAVYPIALAGVCNFLFIPAFIPSGRRRKLKKEERELARFLEQKIQQAKDVEVPIKENFSTESPLQSQTPFTVDKIVAKPILPPQIETPPDFSHVKSVLERLNYFPLSPNEKKQAKELEITVRRIESGENTPELKNRVNDGLGALLKIMAKHGV